MKIDVEWKMKMENRGMGRCGGARKDYLDSGDLDSADSPCPPVIRDEVLQETFGLVRSIVGS